jgi:hypothetical protein
MKYETMTCNGKAISKVMGWGMILKMIRDKNGTVMKVPSPFSFSVVFTTQLTALTLIDTKQTEISLL